MQRNITLIVALDRNGLIGNGDELPWRLPADMKHFKETTLHSSVIMGSKTWYSIPEKFRPLEDRMSIILSRSASPEVVIKNLSMSAGTMTSKTGSCIVNSLEDALDVAYQDPRPIFVIGGTSIYQQFLDAGLITHMVITRIDAGYEGDTYFPEFNEDDWEVTQEYQGGKNNFLTFQYLKKK